MKTNGFERQLEAVTSERNVPGGVPPLDAQKGDYANFAVAIVGQFLRQFQVKNLLSEGGDLCATQAKASP